MWIKDLPWFNTPYKKIEKKGFSSLDSAELLSILLTRGSKKESVLELSNRLLNKPKLNHFEHMGFEELIEEIAGEKVKKNSEGYNLARAKARRIFAFIGLAKEYNKLKNKGFKTSIKEAKDVYDFLVDKYGSLKKEHFICLYLDTKKKIIGEEVVVSIGTLNSSLVHPREVFKTAIKESADSIILVHNHPSGSCGPSVEDEKITKIFKEAGDLLGIKLLDHVIIGKNEFYSFKEQKMLI
jgi:DNA repair protein RadC